jgi:hypothetical protein
MRRMIAGWLRSVAERFSPAEKPLTEEVVPDRSGMNKSMFLGRPKIPELSGTSDSIGQMSTSDWHRGGYGDSGGFYL